MRLTRDTLIVLVALGLGSYEVVVGGGRPTVLTFCIALLGSPLLVRLDDQRRRTARIREANGDSPADE